ncbi:MAG: hypothetical protein WAW22_04640 [Smithellaceae bacterium]
MKKYLFLIVTSLLFLSAMQVSFAQTQITPEIKDFQDRLNKIETTNNHLRTVLQQIENNNKIVKNELNSIKQLEERNMANITSIRNELNDKISDNKATVETKIMNVEETVSRNKLYWIIAVLAIALLSILLYGLIRRQLAKKSSDLFDNIQQTKKALEEEGIKLDNKLIELLGTQMQLIKSEQISSNIKTEDHALALKVADEVVRIQNNLVFMNFETKGLKQLVAAVKRIQDNLEANGYELVDMRNKPYDEGMKLIANFKPDENLKEGEQIITRIIKPQVNYKGVMIQQAQVEVSTG